MGGRFSFKIDAFLDMAARDTRLNIIPSALLGQRVKYMYSYLA